MKLTFLLCLVALAAAAPEKDAYTLVDERTDSGDGHFSYNFETSNGISAQKTGTPGSEGQSNMQGSFRFMFPDGTVAEVRYVADENGYQTKFELPATLHPLPAHEISKDVVPSVSITVHDRPNLNPHAVAGSPV